MKTIGLRTSSLIFAWLLLLATSAFAADESGPLKILGRGLENRESGDVLQLKCIGDNDELGEPSCELLQPIVSKVDGGIIAVGAPGARESTMAEGYSDHHTAGSSSITVTFWEKLFRLNRRLEIYHDWESDLYNGFNPSTYRKTTELPEGDWQTAQSLRDRSKRLWQFSPLGVSAHDFKGLLRVIAVDDESTSRVNHCSFSAIDSFSSTADSGEPFIGDSILHFLGELPAVGAQAIRGKYGDESLSDTAGTAHLLREFYDFRPSEVGFRVVPIYTKPDSRDHGKRFGLGTNVWSCVSLRFRAMSGQVFETKKYCKSSVKHRWKAFIRSFPSCADLER